MLKNLWLVLLLSSVALAEGSPRDWVLTVDDLKSKLPAHYRPKRNREKFEHGDYIVSSYAVYTYTDLKQGIFLISQVNTEPSSWDASTSYLSLALGARYGFADKDVVDYSKTVAAGQQSQARYNSKSDTWSFTFRQRRAWGMLFVSGFSIKPKEMDALLEGYTARVNSLQVHKQKPMKKRGIWRLPWGTSPDKEVPDHKG